MACLEMDDLLDNNFVQPDPNKGPRSGEMLDDLTEDPVNDGQPTSEVIWLRRPTGMLGRKISPKSDQESMMPKSMRMKKMRGATWRWSS